MRFRASGGGGGGEEESDEDESDSDIRKLAERYLIEDDDGDKIPNDQRMTLANVILTDKGIAEGYSIPTQSEVDTKMNALKAEIDATANNKTSGKAKLKSGDTLTDDEISALFGD